MLLGMIINLESNLYGFLKKEYKLSRTDVLIILALYRGGSRTLYSLSQELPLDRAGISRRLTYLEIEGYVSKIDLTDKKIIMPTAKCNKVIETAKEVLLTKTPRRIHEENTANNGNGYCFDWM